ncbi:MAG TPA: penicillin-binding protein 1C [Gammaproteobacteria bacterium]
MRGRNRWRAGLLLGAAALGAAALALTAATLAGLRDLPTTLEPPAPSAPRIVDRHGMPLSVSYTEPWNVHDRVALHEVPPLLRAAFVAAEDKRFFEHDGVDWWARLAALATNVAHGRAVRGASTITEQVVRMLHPRPRTLWSRWLEGFEAMRLERAFSKGEILELYLNQVPYAANRRGVVQAARYYFNRDLDTLNRKEMLALAVLVRAPSRLDLVRAPHASEGAIERLADALVAAGALDAAERAALEAEPLALEPAELDVRAPHFVRHVRTQIEALPYSPRTVRTTLDGSLQRTVQALLDRRIAALAANGVRDGAVLVADHRTGEVLAWVVAGGGREGGPVTHIDAVTTPRQPGSALKPFVYALALDSGWTAAHVVEDAPLAEPTAFGLHSYRNYSRRFYGPVTVRDALGNSLNIPALKALQHVGAERFLDTLHALGFRGLDEHPDHYGDGIALGSGAVTLLELVQAYAALANGGVARPLRTLLDDAAEPGGGERVFSAEAASLIGNILSDPEARALEFGRDSVLAFPLQTAVKTGTSSDFRDAWAVGYDYRHVVGVWLGNLDQTPSAGVSGSTGPALLLRSVFAELARTAQTRPLYLSPRLTRRTVCVPVPGAALEDECVQRAEWFAPGTGPEASLQAQAAGGETRAVGRPARAQDAHPIRLRRPTEGLLLAYDPRLPPESQAFEFAVDGVAPGDRVEWHIDDEVIAAEGGRYLWSVERGEHRVAATVLRDGTEIARLGAVRFIVK